MFPFIYYFLRNSANQLEVAAGPSVEKTFPCERRFTGWAFRFGVFIVEFKFQPVLIVRCEDSEEQMLVPKSDLGLMEVEDLTYVLTLIFSSVRLD